MSLDWNDNLVEEGVAAYVVHRSTSAAGPFVAVTRVAVSEYTDSDPSNGDTYYFRVTAVDAAGNESAGSLTVSATPTAPPAAQPEPIPSIALSAAGFKVKGLQRTSLSWTGGTSGSFAVFRDGVRISTVQSASGGSYEGAIGKKGGGSYSYEVCQLSADGGHGACSNTVTVTF